MSERDFHPLVKQLLDGDITIADLPAELRREGEEALQLLAAVDRRPVELPAVPDRVMRALVRAPQRSSVRRLFERPWVLAPALALAAALVLWLGWPAGSPIATQSAGTITVRFVLAAPNAREVSVAGTFNQWDARATPLVRSGANGVWSATITLPAGQHQYAFVVDGERWMPDDLPPPGFHP